MDYLVQFKDNDPKKSHLLLSLTKQSVAKFKITDIDASDIFPYSLNLQICMDVKLDYLFKHRNL